MGVKVVSQAKLYESSDLGAWLICVTANENYVSLLLIAYFWSIENRIVNRKHCRDGYNFF